MTTRQALIEKLVREMYREIPDLMRNAVAPPRLRNWPPGTAEMYEDYFHQDVCHRHFLDKWHRAVGAMG